MGENESHFFSCSVARLGNGNGCVGLHAAERPRAHTHTLARCGARTKRKMEMALGNAHAHSHIKAKSLVARGGETLHE